MRSLFYILFLLLLPAVMHAQITTKVGTGDSSVLGDGGPAVNCNLKYPSATALDYFGNLYIADQGHNRIRKVDTTGIITTIAGVGISGFSGDGGPASVAMLSSPNGIAIDSAGNIYICDAYRLRKINTSGIITTIAGTGSTWYNGDNIPATDASIAPNCVAIDTRGNLYVGDGINNRVRKIDTAGIITTIAGDGSITTYTGNGGPATAASVGFVADILVDKTGNIFVSCISYWVICKIDTFGIITLIAGPGGSTAENIPATNTHLYSPDGIALDDSGNLYICDSYHFKVRKVNQYGMITTCAGTGTRGFSGDGGYAVSAELDIPRAVTVDKKGNLYITDWKNNRIRYVDNHKNVSVNRLPAGILTASLYPNPTRNEITITTTREIESIEVVNMLGQTINTSPSFGYRSGQAHPKERVVLLSVAHLPAGIYFVKVNGVYAGKFVKE